MIYLQNYSFNDAYIKHQSSHYFEKCYKCNNINSTDVAHLIPCDQKLSSRSLAVLKIKNIYPYSGGH